MIISAIIVTYYPSIKKVTALVNALNSQQATVVIVDNTPLGDSIIPSNFSGAHVIYMKQNIGIAAAQNRGVEFAKSIESDILIFFDQDSYISDNFVDNMALIFDINDLIVCCPVSCDVDTDVELPAYKLNNFGCPRKVYSHNKNKLHAIDMHISSGTVTTMKTMELVGGFNEKMFIDYVDFEWCMRCRDAGVPVLLNPKVLLLHKIGDGNVNCFGKTIVEHSDSRTYYKVRNSVLIFKIKEIPFLYSLHEFASISVQVFLMLCKRRKINLLRIYMRAFSDAIRLRL